MYYLPISENTISSTHAIHHYILIVVLKYGFSGSDTHMTLTYISIHTNVLKYFWEGDLLCQNKNDDMSETKNVFDIKQ